MRKIEWKDTFSVGVKALDEQHQELFSYLNTIFAIFEDPSQREKTGEVLLKLEEYARVHFTTEEKLFEKHKFYGTKDHQKEHHLYEEKIKEFNLRMEKGNDRVLEDMLEFLADWWMGHIQGCDKDYTRFLNNSGVF